MKPIKILFCATLAGAMALAARHASATPQVFPWVKLSISGNVNCGIGTPINYGTVTEGLPLQNVSLSSQNLINLLNSSPTFVAALVEQFGANTNQIPAGSYFIWNIGSYSLVITNKNGFAINLNNNDAGTTFGYLDADADVLVGTFSKNTNSFAGKETDQTGIFFYFKDFNGNQISVYGSATLTWTYAAMSDGNQQATLSVSMSAVGYYARVSGNDGITTEFTATGSGAGLDPIGENPFFQWSAGP